MKKSVWAMLNEQEKELLRKVEPDALRELDEDELSAVHDRIRRARNKYSKNYRRQAAAQVGKDASRAKAHAKNARTAVKAEAFEDALARTSRRLAKLARDSADELKAERLAAARAVKGGKGGKGGKARQPAARGSKVKAASGKEQRRTPSSKRDQAAARAATRRTEAKRGRR